MDSNSEKNWNNGCDFMEILMRVMIKVIGWCFMDVSAFGSPDDVVPVIVSIAEEKDPLIVGDVGSSSPWRIVSEDFDIPSSAKGLFDFLLNVQGVAVEVTSIGLKGLVDSIEGTFLLSISDSFTVGGKNRLNIFSVDSTLGESGFLGKKELMGLLELQVGLGAEGNEGKKNC